MAVRSRRLAGPVTLSTSSETTIYTVPSGRTAIVRLIALADTGAGGCTVGLSINPGSGAARFARSLAVPASGSITFTAPLILNPGDVLSGRSVTDTCGCWVFGSLLLGEPS